ncbi:MAG: hypothetical protein JWN29_2165 [Acidimicrobiales bacterium]|nr:hypothetical protein [Acidimicrobiales bacterium]
MSDPLEELLAKQAITEQLHRYCHGLDRFDRDLADIWHPGGTASYAGIFEGTGAGFLDWVWPVHEGFEATSHQVTNILIDVHGDRATSETYVTVCLRAATTDIVDRGRYVDAWSRRDGTWAIDERRFIGDIQQILPRGAQQ